MSTGDNLSDQPRPVATGRDSRYSLTVEEAGVLYEKAGHPRTPRTIQRYCATGHLDSTKIDPAVNDKYLIDPVSLSRHVAQIEELARLDFRATGGGAPRPVAAEIVQESTGDTARQEGATGDDMSPLVAQPDPEKIKEAVGDLTRQVATIEPPVSPPVAAVQPDVSRLVAGLEREVERLLEDRQFDRDQILTKDKQIESLLERDRETNFLIRGLQEMIPRLASGRPEQPEERQRSAD
jgi:hypothetical protein